MRVRTFAAAATGLLLFGFLGFRILDLEQRVARLSDQVGQPGDAAPGEPTQARASSGASSGRNYEQRLAALEKRMDALSAALSRDGARSADNAPGNPSKEQAILAVVERENSRIRDVQLEWHRARWLETREEQLKVFANQVNLSPDRTNQLHQVIEHELDQMIGIMKRPGFADDPDQVATDWKSVLSDTDRRAAAILSPEQQQFWQWGRAVERKTLWAWLPNETPAQ